MHYVLRYVIIRYYSLLLISNVANIDNTILVFLSRQSRYRYYRTALISMHCGN